jgi:hypothetical protein
MSGEHVPWWNRIRAGGRQLSYFRRSHLEAAARLALWEDFDCKSFDALCVSLLGEDSEAHAVKAPQDRLGDPRDTDFALFSHTAESHGLLCTWLLSICEELLDPRLGRAQPISRAGSDEARLALRREGSEHDSEEAAAQASLGLSRWPNDQRSFLRRASTSFLWRAMEASVSPELARDSSLQKRFAYFVDKVRPLQVWRDDGGTLFLQLKGIAQRLMDGVARACDERYAALVAEPCGKQLAGFYSLGAEPMKVHELLTRTSSLEEWGAR